MCASRRASSPDVLVPARTAAIASPTAANAGTPSPRCSTTSSHQRSASGSPAAAASAASGSTRPGTRRSSSLVASAQPARCVDRSNRPVVGQGPADRLPLRAELGERPERGSRHVGRQVAEQGDGGPQTRVADPASSDAASAGSSTSTIAGSQLVEGAHDRARRPRSVMSHAEQVQAGRGARGISRGRGRRRRTRPSRHGRAPPPRGTRATPRRRGSGHVTTAPTTPAAMSPGDSRPSPKWAARARPLVTTEIASAVDSVPLGVFRLVRPSLVCAVAQLAEDRDDASDLVRRRRARRAGRGPSRARRRDGRRWPSLRRRSPAAAARPC